MPGILGGSDIGEMIDDLAQAGGAVEVSFGSATTWGLFDRASAELFAGEMPVLVADAEGVHIKAGTLPGVRSGSDITVDGTTYTVQKVTLHGDGAMEFLALGET